MSIRTYFSRNERNRRIIARGRLPRRELASAQVKSRIPIYRNKINRAHGNPHREDARIARTTDQSLRKAKIVRERILAHTRADPSTQATRNRLVRADQTVQQAQARERQAPRQRPARQQRTGRAGR